MAMLVTDVLDFLEDESLIAGETGWTRAAGYLPPTPDKVIAVFETPGPRPESRSPGSDETEYDRPTFQVRGRGDGFGYEELRTKMDAIFRALHGSELSPGTSDPQYVFVYATQSGPFPLGLDKENRPGLTWNFKALRERET